MEVFFWLFVCAALFAIGDVLGVATKAKVSSVFVALLLFLVGFMTKIFPSDMISLAGLTEIGKWSVPMIVFHMGTTINMKQLAREWRTVVMSLVAMIAAGVGILAVAPLLGVKEALVAIPVINGGIVATQIMTDGAMALGLALPAALGTVLYAVQKFVGTPPASFFGVREANRILAQYRSDKQSGVLKARKEAEAASTRVTFAMKYDKYFTAFVRIAICAGGGALSKWLETVTGVNYSIIALVLGVGLAYIGIIPNKLMLDTGLINMTVFASIIPSLAKIELGQLVTLGFQVILVVVALFVGTLIVVWLLPTWKLVGSRDLAVGIAMAQLIGFPATMLVANEIAAAVTDDKEEREAVLDRLLPAYVVAGMATVTTLSIVIAGVFVKFL